MNVIGETWCRPALMSSRLTSASDRPRARPANAVPSVRAMPSTVLMTRRVGSSGAERASNP
jgi:hypothetical protein